MNLFFPLARLPNLFSGKDEEEWGHNHCATFQREIKGCSTASPFLPEHHNLLRREHQCARNVVAAARAPDKNRRLVQDKLPRGFLCLVPFGGIVCRQQSFQCIWNCVDGAREVRVRKRPTHDLGVKVWRRFEDRQLNHNVIGEPQNILPSIVPSTFNDSCETMNSRSGRCLSNSGQSAEIETATRGADASACGGVSTWPCGLHESDAPAHQAQNKEDVRE